MDRGERVIEVCNSRSSIRPGLVRFLAIFVFVSFCHFLMTPVRLLFFSCSLWFVLFGGVFFLLYPHFLPRVFSILPGLACVLCFIWIYLDFWIFRSQIPISLLANPSINPLSPLQFAHEPYFSLLAEQCSKYFSFLSNSNFFHVLTGLVGVSCFF